MTDHFEDRHKMTTYYHPETQDAVRKALEFCHSARARVRVWLGDTSTGRAWAEEHDVTGYIGRSTGKVKIPLLIYNQRSTGGGGLLDHCIVRIDHIQSRRTLYAHPEFDPGQWQALGSEVYQDGALYARCKDAQQAERLVNFMTGARYAK